MQQALAIVAIEHLVCMPDFFVQGQAHGGIGSCGLKLQSASNAQDHLNAWVWTI
jgi:hypothetical protein